MFQIIYIDGVSAVPSQLRQLHSLTGEAPLDIPLNDKKTLSLFTSTEALGIAPENIGSTPVGTLGIPEFCAPYVRKMLEILRPYTPDELMRISALNHGTGVWEDNADRLIASGTAQLKDIPCTRDDIMNTLIRYGMDRKTAYEIMESVRRGKWAKHREPRQEEMEKAMRDKGVPEWFIETCEKIGYLFPKAHIACYVTMAFRIAYYKAHYPEAFYAAYFTVHAPDFKESLVRGTKEDVEKAILDIKAGMRSCDQPFDVYDEPNMQRLLNLEVLLEMYARSIRFLPPDPEKGDKGRYVAEDGNVRLPLEFVNLKWRRFVRTEKIASQAARTVL